MKRLPGDPQFPGRLTDRQIESWKNLVTKNEPGVRRCPATARFSHNTSHLR
jgi:hypothetical protein